MKNKILTLLFMYSSVLFAQQGNNITTDSTKLMSISAASKIYDQAEVMPKFPGGANEMSKFIGRNTKYPDAARVKNVSGKVVVKFYIDITGKAVNPIIIKDSVGNGAAEETMRVINSMPKWIPGSQNGQAVNCYIVLPFTFKTN